MAQVTIYIDDETRRKIETAARRAEVSVSAWVKRRLQEALEREWPPGWFDLLGSLADSDFARPDPLDEKRDVSREAL